MALDKRKAYQIVEKRKNFDAWLQGYYIDYSLRTSIASAFGEKDSRYFEEPIPLTQADVEEQQERREKRKYDMMISRMRTESDQIKKEKGEITND